MLAAEGGRSYEDYLSTGADIGAVVGSQDDSAGDLRSQVERVSFGFVRTPKTEAIHNGWQIVFDKRTYIVEAVDYESVFRRMTATARRVA